MSDIKLDPESTQRCFLATESYGNNRVRAGKLDFYFFVLMSAIIKS